MNIRPLAASVWLALACLAAAALPPGTTIKGDLAGLDELPIVAEKPLTVTVPLAERTGGVRLRVKAGAQPGGVGIALRVKTPKRGAFDPRVDVSLRAGDLKLASGQTWTDAYLTGPKGAGRIFTRPNAFFYKPERLKTLAAEWAALPAASAHVAEVDVRFHPGGTATTWIDGRFVDKTWFALGVELCEIRLAPGAELQSLEFLPRETGGVLPLPLHHFVAPAWAAAAEIALSPGVTLPAGMDVRGPSPDLAVAGLGRLSSPSDDLVSYAWRRSGLDALPEVCIFSVPQTQYTCAHVLCAAPEDPARDPAFTLRLTRYGMSRGGAMADSIVRVPAPGSAATADCQEVGTVQLGAGVRRQTVPLWLIRVPLKTGRIQDLLTTDKQRGADYTTHEYLDLEVMDPLEGVEENDAFPQTLRATGRVYTPRGKESSAHVLGLALEQNGEPFFVMDGRVGDTIYSSEPLKWEAPANIFYAAEKPRWRVRGPAQGIRTMAWDFADVDGKIVVSGSKQYAGDFAIPIDVPTGWYSARTRLLDEHSHELIDHRSTFVMLPPDTRKAGFESPYGAWWFHWAHGGEPNIERVGPMLQRAGLRHTILPKSLPESLTAPYGVSAPNIGWFRPKDPKAPLAERLAAHEAYIREQLELYPSLDKVLVWHESGAGGAAFPSEMWGETPAPATEAVEQNWQTRLEYITALAKMVRTKFPQLKLQYGNDGSSLNLIAGLLRHKFPRELIDSFAVEDLGQTIIPEKAIPGGLQSAWYLRETARALGYGDVPITACHEWIGRRDQVLGLGTQAEWCVRDALHARAYGFQTSGNGVVHDAGNGYYHTIWGGTGLTSRYPAMDPKPSYAAVATLTRMLDGVKFSRAVPTGSHSLYAAEFRRGDEWVYAAWVPRGRRAVKARFAAETGVAMTDLYGRETNGRGTEFDLTASTAAQYLVCRSPLASVTAGKAWFPEDEPPKNPTVADALDTLAHWSIQADKDKRLERVTGEFMPHRTQGPFELREVQDAEQGKCLELELKPVGEVWDVMHEYAVLKLANPIAAAGPFAHAGVWVKGNSGWGEVMWEMENARGEKWLSQGVYMDWPGHIAINFDGWNFLRLPLRPEPAWRAQVKITGLVVTMPRKTLYLTEMERVPELKVRLKGLCLF